MGRQSFVIRLDEKLARRVSRFLSSEVHGYLSLDEFVHVALQNQLSIEGGDVASAPESGAREPTDDGLGSLLERPGADQRPSLAEPPDVSKDGLFVLTNRLSPVKVAARVLAGLGRHGEWPPIGEFQEKAARTARHVGIRLREADQASDRRGQARRWIAYPVGDDESAAYSRFITSFTLQVNDGRVAGPMAVLGLGNVKEGRAALTEVGWELAAAPSPILDGAEGSTLSHEEATILRRQVLRADGEREVVRVFLQIVKRAAGSQARVDEMLAARYADWTQTLTVAHRSALIGRLCDLGVLEATGRGPNTKLRLLAGAEEFLDAVGSQGAA